MFDVVLPSLRMDFHNVCLKSVYFKLDKNEEFANGNFNLNRSWMTLKCGL